MRNRIAITRNVLNMRDAYRALESAAPGVPRIGLVFGFTGAGKSTAIYWHMAQVEGVYLRASAMWTPTSLLRALAVELRLDEGMRGSDLLMVAAERMAEEQRPLFIDEADYLLQHVRLIETVRDLHDIAQVPVILVGMEGLERRIQARKQFCRRIHQWVEFLPLDLEDTRVVADTVCEVRVSDDLLEALHRQAKGSVGLITVGLARIESFGRASRLDEVTLEDWGDRKFYLHGQVAANA